MKLVGVAHNKLVHSRRIDRLGRLICDLIPQNATVLDVGSGDGTLAYLIGEMRADVSIEGIDVHPRQDTPIRIASFDGVSLPFKDQEFDVVMFVDVLHHTADPMVLLREAARVARKAIIIKDHCDDGAFSNVTLRMMDWVGNKPHGVDLPYNYWKKARWNEAFSRLGVTPESWTQQLNLYPPPIDWLCGRQLHFIAALPVVSG